MTELHASKDDIFIAPNRKREKRGHPLKLHTHSYKSMYRWSYLQVGGKAPIGHNTDFHECRMNVVGFVSRQYARDAFTIERCRDCAISFLFADGISNMLFT